VCCAIFLERVPDDRVGGELLEGLLDDIHILAPLKSDQGHEQADGERVVVLGEATLLRVPDNGVENLPLDQGALVAHVYGRCGLRV
jgi:hypothetical protein